ncbi:cytochrome C biogenesis protein [Sphingomonas naphthae]|uniref:Cytochrome C biogenesis protein n=1 Tax=Sphingomonas naphthae TaxID=1813468 RepID=A0ABY7TQV8_9SPHN|nr:cytochrome C biogenesis protein [Sphingomonas naphthae]WCT74229.1 cytochrome C biogenesis protein [Sphingomonas naphthae]
MIGWLIFLILGALVLAALWRFGGAGRAGTELVLAALLVAAAGYAWQGSPGQPGSLPRERPMALKGEDAFTLQREQLGFASVGGAADVLAASDTLYRQRLGDYAIAQLRAALNRAPGDPELLTGLGQALVRQSEGVVTPAAKLAFDRARTAAPRNPGPPYFLAMAYAQQGDLDSAERLWRDQLRTTPEDAPYFPLVLRNLLIVKATREAR